MKQVLHKAGEAFGFLGLMVVIDLGLRGEQSFMAEWLINLMIGR